MTPRPDMHQQDEPDEAGNRMIGGILLYASGFVMGCILTALVML